MARRGLRPPRQAKPSPPAAGRSGAVDAPCRPMGRIFEVRKHTMFARWNRMAKQFARIAKDITMAVKAGGTDPASQPLLRPTIQKARAAKMSRDPIQADRQQTPGGGRRHY